jgi:hypothetical protein
MNWKFWKKKISPAAVVKEQIIQQQKAVPKWSSSLKKESVIEINKNKWTIIDIGFEFVVVRDSKYKTWQIERRLLENAP